MMPALAWGTIRTAVKAMINRKTASTISAMAPAVIGVLLSCHERRRALLFGHERRGAPDLDDLDAGARLVDLILEVGPGRPHLAVDAHAPGALVVRDPLDHRGVPPDERVRAGADLRRRLAERPGDRAQREDQP